MTESDIRNRILDLLQKSGISSEQKQLVRFSLPFLQKKELLSIHKSLVDERKGLLDAANEEKKIRMKYTVVVDKLADLEIQKAKKN